MEITFFYSLLAAVSAGLVSLAGVMLLSLAIEKLRNIVYFLVAFAAGGLLGDIFFHLFPEMVEESGFSLQISLSILAGILFMFILEKIIHWRHCHYHDHSEAGHVHSFAIMNLVGDAIHNLIDGMVIAVSFMVNIPVGIATTIAVILHEIPQEIGDFGVLIHGGFSKKKALLYNFFISMTAVVGVVLTVAIVQFTDGVAGFLIPFTVGTFLYIAGSDLIPELHKELSAKKSFVQLLSVILGITVMGLLLFLE